jgi:hypothetical protein
MAQLLSLNEKTLVGAATTLAKRELVETPTPIPNSVQELTPFHTRSD